jgi:hypothetical protein
VGANTVNFDSAGKATLGCLRQPEKWPESVDRVRQFLIDHDLSLELGMIRYRRGLTEAWPDVDYSQPRPPVSRAEIAWNPHMFDRYVPDASGAQILTDAHLERANDLSGWNIGQLGPGRHLVEAPDLADWFENEEPTSDVVKAARADFGDMILTPQAVIDDPDGWLPNDLDPNQATQGRIPEGMWEGLPD